MPKILIISQDYPSNSNPTSMRYVHTRNHEYIKHGIDIHVLSFSTQVSYEFEGVRVLSKLDFEKESKRYDALISHAPNIRNHYKFIKRNNSLFPHIFLIFHGHEALNINKVYPGDFDFASRQSFVSRLKQELYDTLKLRIWRRYLPRISNKITLIFVSQWMKDQFFYWTKIDHPIFKEKTHIIYNSIGEQFEKYRFKKSVNPDYDFLTIRNNIDGKKYAIDIVSKCAKDNPDLKFLVIGKGQFFDFNEQPENVTHLKTNLNHSEIFEFMEKSRCALLPTRLDAQGVMACELASCGMPLITSDISVCEEIFDSFVNVKLIPNKFAKLNLKPILAELEQYTGIINTKYFAANTTLKEIDLIKSTIEDKNRK